jgi:glycosyl transferase family 2
MLGLFKRTIPLQRYTEKYFKRSADLLPIINSPIDPLCKIIIVIPCCNEPDLVDTLNSLTECAQLNYPVEVIIVLNHSESAMLDVKQANEQTLLDYQKWQSQNHSSFLKFQLIEAFNQPKKHAGVGMARKVGMDEALRRFTSINENGTIVCLDADCTVSENYLTAINKEFVLANAAIGVMNFEHQYEKEKNKSLKDGIINYELFLRYYVEGLRQAEFPNAIHTIGSCMLVKADTYAKHGGMNKRKAGEDFYFLHKIKPHEEFVTVKKGTVYPSCRTSDRVPFGTGKAQQDWLNKDNKPYLTYDPIVFDDLKILFQCLEKIYDPAFDNWALESPTAVTSFLEAHNYFDKIDLIRANCKSFQQFEKQFYVWFDGFLCLKFVHYARDHYYPNISLPKAASKLIGIDTDDLIDLLAAYRDNDSSSF